MNMIAAVHFFAGIAALAVSWPLGKRKVGMNAVYGFRIDAAFESEQRWYDINAYGGKLLFRGGLMMRSSVAKRSAADWCKGFRRVKGCVMVKADYRSR